MTNQQHPIIPPPELVKQWRNSWHQDRGEFGVYLATQAARWGADQELEACLDHLFRRGFHDADILCLRATRRPKPPSLKAQALDDLDSIQTHDQEGREIVICPISASHWRPCPMTDFNITPPTELVEQWYESADNASEDVVVEVATQAARWGADQELEACGKAIERIWEMDHVTTVHDLLRKLRAVQRPKPLSQAEAGLEQLRVLNQHGALNCNTDKIRTALERLKELEANK